MPLTTRNRNILKKPSAFFCNKSRVKDILQGKRIALVGSGPGVIDNNPGFIDSHEIVVRVNNYKLNQRTGKRTDVFYSFFGNSIKKTATDLRRDGVFLCLCKCPNAQFMESKWHAARRKMSGVDFRYIYDKRASWWFCDTYIPTVEEFKKFFELMGNHVPTTGIHALLDILSYKPASIYMTGFDFFQSGIHNVNERWEKRNLDDPIGHSPETEKEWLKRNAPILPITMDKRLQAVLKE